MKIKTIKDAVEFVIESIHKVPIRKDATSRCVAFGDVKLSNGEEYQIQIKLSRNKSQWIGEDEVADLQDSIFHAN